jgi:hypothetical protein
VRGNQFDAGLAKMNTHVISCLYFHISCTLFPPA